MAIKEFSIGENQNIRGDQLAQEIRDNTSANAVDSEGISITHRINDIRRLFVDNVPDGQETAVQVVISNHVADPLYFDEDKEQAQRLTVNNNVRALFQGLASESPEDAAYIAYGRSVAKINGENNATVLSIDTRAKAVTYITNTPEWSALPVSARNWLALSKQAEMLMWQALIAFVR